MAVVETLEIRFRADLGKFGEQLAALSERISGIGNALQAGRSAFAGNAAGLIREVAEALRGGAATNQAPGEAGRLLAEGFSRGILSGRGAAAQAARMAAAAADYASPAALSAAYLTGAQLSQGFANGITSRSGAVMAAVNRVVNAALSRIRSALQIHSPSRVSFEIGGYFGEGFADGIRASIRMAEEGAAAISGAAASALAAPAAVHNVQDAAGLGGMVRAAVDEALGGTSIVVPLHVDGMKLGEASIRGINRVTRSAGRLMLEI